MRPEYEGMGLGLFIAKTLLERSGAELSFANASDPMLPKPQAGKRSGAIVEVRWPREAVSQNQDSDARGLGENRPIEV